MFDIGWSEMAVIAIVALVVLGPKELPNALKTATHWLRTARKMAREFQSGVDQIVRDAELDEARKTVQQARRINVGQEIEKVVDPTGETKRQLNQQPTTSPTGPSPTGKSAEGTPPASGPKAIGSATPASEPLPREAAAESPAKEPAAAAPAGAAASSSEKPEPEPAAAGDRHG